MEFDNVEDAIKEITMALTRIGVFWIRVVRGAEHEIRFIVERNGKVMIDASIFIDELEKISIIGDKLEIYGIHSQILFISKDYIHLTTQDFSMWARY